MQTRNNDMLPATEREIERVTEYMHFTDFEGHSVVPFSAYHLVAFSLKTV